MYVTECELSGSTNQLYKSVELLLMGYVTEGELSGSTNQQPSIE
jgi:hypothetical protein